MSNSLEATVAQRLLEEGSFTASYKYALLVALADLAVEKGDGTSAELPISLDEIAASRQTAGEDASRRPLVQIRCHTTLDLLMVRTA